MLQTVYVVSHGLTLRGKFVNWMKKNNIGRKDSYYGGWTVWVSDFGQSIARKENYARAFAKVLGDYGITAYII